MGTTIGNVVISYDINKSHTQVKDDMIDLGYFDYFTLSGSNKKYYLPNTTLWHKSKSSNQAMSDLKAVCRNLGVTLEKAISVKASEFVGI